MGAKIDETTMRIAAGSISRGTQSAMRSLGQLARKAVAP